MTNHKNDERTVKCPVEGCDATPLARGINLHVMLSEGGGHGPRGDVPGRINLDNLETVGEREVEMDYPEERDTEEVVRLCPYCFTPFQGTNGVLIHLGSVAGRKNHPENAAESHGEDDFPRVEVDRQGNVTNVFNDLENVPEDSTGGGIPKRRVYYLIADLMARGDVRPAHRVRARLLGVEQVDRTLRENPSHWDLFHELLTHSQAGPSDHSLTATLEKEGIMVACRGESALYTAAEARRVAEGLERATHDDPRNDDVPDLIEFLRYGADVLDSKDTSRNLHEEFGDWR